MSGSPAGLTVAVQPAGPGDQSAAAKLAAELDVLLLQTDVRPPADIDAILRVSGVTLSLQQARKSAPGPARPGPVTVDFGSAAMRHRRRAAHNELVGRAVGLAKKPRLRVLDATAGLGRDAFVLADLGCEVALCEREPVVAALLAWGLRAAAGSGDPWLVEVVQRMALYPLDARRLDARVLQPLDVIYLDPMFPPRVNSAAVKKEMALLQLLLDTDDPVPDASALLSWAVRQPVARVVVKRPPRAPPLGGRQPSHSIGGKAVRYDVHVLRTLGT